MSSKKNITTLAELDAAQRQVKRELDIKKTSIEKRFESAKDFYNPSNVATNVASDIVNGMIPLLDWKPVVLTLVRALKKKL